LLLIKHFYNTAKIQSLLQNIGKLTKPINYEININICKYPAQYRVLKVNKFGTNGNHPLESTRFGAVH